VLFGGSGGVANLKTVPIYQGVTDVFLRSSCTGPDETLATCGSIAVVVLIMGSLVRRKPQFP
jgi:hypothetical protein